MTEWEVFINGEQGGPFAEADVLAAIGKGMTPKALVRRAGTEEWKALRSHAPFAAALEQAKDDDEASGGVSRLPSAPRAQAVPVPSSGLTWKQIASVAVPVALALAGIAWWTFHESPDCSRSIEHATQALESRNPDVAKLHIDKAFISCADGRRATIDGLQVRHAKLAKELASPSAPRPVLSVTTAVQTPLDPHGWATLPKPGRDTPNTGDARLAYMSSVLNAHPGEPPINKARAEKLMVELRRGLADAAGIAPTTIKAGAGDAAGSLIVGDGVVGKVAIKGEVAAVAVCSEAYLATALLSVGLEKFQSAGVRGVLCKSTGCTAIFDLRPTSGDGGGVYNGDNCVSLADMMGAALLGD